MAEELIALEPNFSTADAESVAMDLNSGRLRVHYRDWQSRQVGVLFEDVSTLTWVYSEVEGDRPYEVLNSALLLKFNEPQLRHFRLYFNTHGTLDVIAVSIAVTVLQP